MFAMLLSWKKLDSYKLIILILSINILFSTVGTDWINVIFEDFLYVTVRFIVCQTIVVLLIFIFVKSPEDILLYAFFVQFGTLSANILNIFYIRNKLNISVRITKRLNLKNHLKPIVILFGNSVSALIYLQADSTMLGLFIGDIAVGYYTVASKIYSLIKQLLNSVSNVALPHFSYDLANHSGDINRKFNGLLGVLLILVLPSVVGVLCVGKEIILFFPA